MVEDCDYDNLEWLMNINFWGVVHGTQAFLPYLKQQDWGHVVNLSSLFGLMSVPNQSAYNAAKFAVRGLTQSLALELVLQNASFSNTRQAACDRIVVIPHSLQPSAQYAESSIRFTCDIVIRIFLDQFNQ